MKKRRLYLHILSFCLTVFLCFTDGLPVFSAAVAPSDIPEHPADTENGISCVSGNGSSETGIPALVTAIRNEAELTSLQTFTLPLKSSADTDNMTKIYLLALKYRTVSATVTADGESREENFSVSWDFSDIDQTKAGEYYAVGSIELPAGYAFGENVLQKLQIPVIVKELPPAVITSVEVWYPYTNAYAFPQGSSPKALKEMIASSPYYLECYTDNGDSYTATVEWDFSDIDFGTVGLYDAKGSISAPEGTVFGEALSLPEISIPVSIQAVGKPDINCLIVSGGSLLFPWVTPPGNMEEISVLLSEDSGSWIRLEEDFFYADQEMLSVSTYLLTHDSSYRLQVEYEGGRTGILSFSYADEIILEGYHDGDRDGGDADGNPPSDMTQPAPEAPGSTDDNENTPADPPPFQTTNPSEEDNDGADEDDTLSDATENPPAGRNDSTGADSGSGDAQTPPAGKDDSTETDSEISGDAQTPEAGRNDSTGTDSGSGDTQTPEAPAGNAQPTENPADEDDTISSETGNPSDGRNDNAGAVSGSGDAQIPEAPAGNAQPTENPADEDDTISNATQIPSSDGNDNTGADSGSGDTQIPEAPAGDAQTPEPPADEAPANPVILEYFGETTDRISGTRFLMMLQTGNRHAVFSKQGITVSIPEDALPDAIRDEDQIEVTIEKKQDGGFSFLFSINGSFLDSLPNVRVTMPYSPKPAPDTLYLTDENDTEFPMTAYDDAAKAASFFINHTGTYLMTTRESASGSLRETVASDETGRQWRLFLLPGCLLLLSAGAILLRRRQK